MRSSKSCVAAAMALQLLLSMPVYGKKPSKWELLVQQGRQQLDAGSLREAKQTLDQAVADSRLFKTGDPRLGAMYQALGHYYLKEQEYGTAKGHFEQALPIVQAVHGPDSLEVADILYGLSTCYQQQESPNMSETLLKRVVEIWSQKLGSTDRKLARALSLLATSATLNSDYPFAQKTLRRLVDLQEKNYGASSNEVAYALNSLALSLANTGQFAEAEPLANRAVNLLSRGGKGIGYESALDNLLYIRQQLGMPGPDEDSRWYGAEGSQKPGAPATAEQAGEKPVTAASSAPAESAGVESKPATAVSSVPAESAAVESKPATTTSSVPAESAAVESKPATAASSVPEESTAGETRPVAATSSAPAEDASVASKPITAAVEVERDRTGGDTTDVTAEPGTADGKPSAGKPVSIAARVPTVLDRGSATEKSGSTVEQPKALRAPSTPAVLTSPADFRPWELKGDSVGTVARASGDDRKTQWGRIRYLAGGKLISQEEYKAMVLANEAYELIRAERYRMAINVLNKALATCDILPSAHTNLGLALAQLGRTQEAIARFRQAIALDATRSAPWINLASSFQMNGQLREAVATYQEYARRFADDPLAARANDLVEHLSAEVKRQEMVEKILAAANQKSTTDYFAYATHEQPIRWNPSKPALKVFIEPGTGVEGYKAEYSGLLKDAFKQWAAVSDGKIDFQYINKAADADIHCKWSNDPSEVHSPSEGGDARIRSSAKGIEHATITILTCDPSPDSALSPNQIRAVSLHEIGHALGIVGHSPVPTDVMYCSMPSAAVKVNLSQRDIQTLRRLYSTEIAVEKGRNLQEAESAAANESVACHNGCVLQ